MLAGLRVGFVGRLAAMSRAAAFEKIERQGGAATDQIDSSLDILVVGGDNVPLADDVADVLSDELAERVKDGRLLILREPELWQRLGLADGERDSRQLYTPAMLAELLKVDVAVVRRWERRGLIVPARQAHRLSYFDFQEVAAARRLAALLAAGVSAAEIEKKLAHWRRYLPGIERPLAQLSIIVQGRELLLREGDGLIEAGGQRRFDFEANGIAIANVAVEPEAEALELTTPAQMIGAAEDLEDRGALSDAAEMYRAALSAGGASAEINFRLAELLYRQGDLPAARERYYMALELDEDYVEARANLGCVLAESGQKDLAIAAFEGVLARHAEYPDAHYQLARALDEAGRHAEARRHWESFVELAPESPWADTARERLGTAR